MAFASINLTCPRCLVNFELFIHLMGKVTLVLLLLRWLTCHAQMISSLLIHHLQVMCHYFILHRTTSALCMRWFTADAGVHLLEVESWLYLLNTAWKSTRFGCSEARATNTLHVRIGPLRIYNLVSKVWRCYLIFLPLFLFHLPCRLFLALNNQCLTSVGLDIIIYTLIRQSFNRLDRVRFAQKCLHSFQFLSK